MKSFSVDVNITQKHIDKGIAGDCAKCVVALAVVDAVAKAKKIKKSSIKVSTVHSVTLIQIGETRFMAHHPDKIHRLISMFDAGKKINPDSFKANFKEKSS